MPPPDYLQGDSRLESQWRGLILFGKNSASYKFALAKALLELKPQGDQLLRLEDIAPAYARHLVDHLRTSPRQVTRQSSPFIDALRLHGIDAPDPARLVEETVRRGFVNVIGAFQVLGQSTIDRPFYIDEVRSHGGIRMTDHFGHLMERQQSSNLMTEAESRWRLVERAWSLGMSEELIAADYDPPSGELLMPEASGQKRKPVTSARGALNGYQKGKCFYCFDDIRVDDGRHTHVDHFHPHTLSRLPDVGSRINGVWNLVLACADCNGAAQKGSRIPVKPLLERLGRRNDYLIASNHPLRETLLLQTGLNVSQRKTFLNDFYDRHAPFLGQPWTPKHKAPPAF